ncbi:MAG: twin-arginine translocase TatA/TatE family subunit [Candidatus Omnitrophica bacterium]|nr:twin-arginine translocase TatA/TatE family subunit [Candidatus Omnitrophota bacterium]MCA9407100.1 twin-arginine translocase TatA/TatE family subunit [Candidatus Omnitrophota bacterium]
MFGLGAAELFFIFLIVFFLFGAKNLPEIAKSMGKAIRSFRKGVHEIEDDIQSISHDIDKSKDDSKISIIHKEKHA